MLKCALATNTQTFTLANKGKPMAKPTLELKNMEGKDVKFFISYNPTGRSKEEKICEKRGMEHRNDLQ